MVARKLAFAFALAALAAGCGTPSTAGEQAELVHSIGAEGALLAGDVANGRSLSPFAETHARALRENAIALRSSISHPRLRRVANDVADELGRLASAPGDRDVAAEAGRRLEEAARRAEAIGAGAS